MYLAEFPPDQRKGGQKDSVHVVILVLAQAAAEDGLGIGIGQSPVLLVEGGVGLVVDGVVGLIAGLPLGGVFPGDDGLGLGAELEVLMLDDPGVGGLTVGVVDHGVALIVGGIQHLGLEADGPVAQGTVAEAEVGVDGAGVDDLAGHGVPFVLLCQIVLVQPHLDAVQHIGDHLRIAAFGDALIFGVEIVVVEGQPHGEPLDDEGRQLRAGAAPLLLGVALHQLLVNVGADEGNGLLLQISGLGDPGGGALTGDLCLGLLGSHHAPHPVEGVHVEGQGVELAVVVGHGGVGVAVELGKAVHIIPDSAVVGMENMGAVAVDIDVFDGLGVDIAADVAALVDDQHGLSGIRRRPGKGRAEQTGTHDQIIVIHRASFFQSVFLCNSTIYFRRCHPAFRGFYNHLFTSRC